MARPDEDLGVNPNDIQWLRRSVWDRMAGLSQSKGEADFQIARLKSLDNIVDFCVLADDHGFDIRATFPDVADRVRPVAVWKGHIENHDAGFQVFCHPESLKPGTGLAK